MKTFFGQRCTDVYFTSSGSFLMHYSKRYKNCHSQSRGIVFVIVIIPDFVFKCIAKLFFFAAKGNKLSTAPQHLLLDDAVNSRGLQPFFFISWTPRWYKDNTRDQHHIFMAICHILTNPSLSTLLPASLLLLIIQLFLLDFWNTSQQLGRSHKYFHQTHNLQQVPIPFHVNK